MESGYKDGFAEVDEIFKYIDDESLEKIPQDVKTLIKVNKSNLTVDINPNKSLNEQELLYETKVILSVLYKNYWATEEEKKQIIESEEEFKKLHLKEEKYSYEDLFKKNKKIPEIKRDQIATVSESVLKKILDKIKGFFRLGAN